MKEYQREIDGLRAIAVLAVIAFHFNEKLVPNGYLGVDVFFVISGYVISKSLARYSADSIQSSLITFYSRRIKRLLPALVTCVIVSALMACIFTPRPSQTIATAILSLIGFSNIYLYRSANDYFGESAESNFFTHTWSLGVEEQFYLVFPLIFFVLYSSAKKTEATWYFILMGMLIATSCALYLLLSKSHPNATFYLLPFRFWEIGVGVLIYHWVDKKGKSVSLHRQSTLYFLLIALILVFAIYPNNHLSIATLLTVLLTASIILTLNQSGNSASTILNHNILTHIGLLSYSLYLWHWTVLVFAYWTVGISIMTTPLLLLAIYALSLTSYKLIELPLRRRSWSEKRVIEITYGIIASVSTSALLIVLLSGSKTPSLLYAGITGNSAIWRTFSSIEENNQNTIYTLSSGQAVSLESFRDTQKTCHLTPHRLGADNPYHGEKPDVDEQFLENCVSSDQRQLIIIGDSFSNVVSKHLFIAASKLGLDVNMIYGYRCPFPLNPENIKFASRVKCDIDPEIIQDALRKHLKSGDILAIRLYLQAYLDTHTHVDIFDDELDNIREIVESKNAKLMIVGTNAALDRTMPCTEPNWFNSTQCSPNEFSFDINSNSRNTFAYNLNKHLETRYNDRSVRMVNPIKSLCDMASNTCPAYKNGTLYYRPNDFTHLSYAAMDRLNPDLESALLELID